MLNTGSVCPNCGQPPPNPPGVSATAARPAAASLPLEKYLKAGWDLFKRFPGGFICFSLFYFLMQAACNSIPWLGWVAGLALPALLMGNFIVSAKLLQGVKPHFSDFFLGFRFFLPLLLAFWSAAALIAIGMLLIVPGVYFLVSYVFAAPLVVDRRLTYRAALRLSRRTVKQFWSNMFIFCLLLLLVNLFSLVVFFNLLRLAIFAPIVNLFGPFAYGLGLLASLPVSCCAVTAAYADLFGWQSDYSEGFPDNLPAEPEISAP
ncbi:MAG: hypothetical protein WBW55_13210 [Desulfobaccales bacterium]